VGEEAVKIRHAHHFIPGSIICLRDSTGGKQRLYRVGARPEDELTPLSRLELVGYGFGILRERFRSFWWRVCPGAERRFFEKIKEKP